MKTVSQFLNTVGRREFRVALGVKEQAISRAKSENVFPATWFKAARDFCADAGHDVPEHLFRWHKGGSDASQ